MAILSIDPGDDFQSIINNADAGDYIKFKPGTHETSTLDANYSMVTIDKTLNIEIMAGATIKLADNSVSLKAPETIDNILPIANATFGGTYSGTTTAQFWVKVDGTGSPNTFRWAKQNGITNGEPAYTNTGVAMTGSAQTLSDGVTITWASTTGNTLNSGLIYVIPVEYHAFRVGTGFQSSYIEDVKIFGLGTIDMNAANNKQHEIYTWDLPSAILFHGRVRRCGVYGITIERVHRPVMAYGDHDGTYLSNGATSGGTSYDAEFIDVVGCNVKYDATVQNAGVLLGHPHHRGNLYNVRVERNMFDAYLQGVEPNFKLNRYRVTNNWFRTRQPYSGVVTCWRRSDNGIINNNTQFISTATFVTQTAPTGWDLPQNITTYGNFNV